MLEDMVYLLRNKARFNFKGLVDVEDLFDLGFDELDKIYRGLRKEWKEYDEDSLIISEEENPQIRLLTAKTNVVKYIFDLKQKEAFEQQRLQEKAEKKQKILSIINDKQDDSLKAKSIDELTEMLNEL